MKNINFQALRDFATRHYLKNRTIVSRDIAGIIDDIGIVTGLPLMVHRYKTGEDYGTWAVPPQWDVREAWIKDERGKVICTYQNHPLFVAPYSVSIDQKVSKKELLQHLFSQPAQPNAFAYNYRLALDPTKRLKEWCLSLPPNTIRELGDGPFHVYIDTEVTDGEMLVGEIFLEGSSPETICFLGNFCHPGQVNDSFSGLLMFMEVMRELSQRETRRHSYSFLIFPETIGSSIYLASEPQRRKDMVGAVFSENIGWGKEWYFKLSRRENSYMDLLARQCCRKFPDLKLASFMEIIGNDEHVFDSPQVNVPSLSLQKYPYDEYHTSNDNVERLQEKDLQRAFDIMMHFIDVAETDAVYRFTHSVPFHMSRFHLYADYTYEHDRYMRNRAIMNAIDGKQSLLQIANAIDLEFSAVADYVFRMAERHLVQPVEGSAFRS